MITRAQAMPRFVTSLLLAAMMIVSAFASDIQLNAQVVWGTDEPAKDKNLKALDTETSEKLRKVLKWKHYYSIRRQDVKVTESLNRVKLSDKCEIELQSMGKSGIEVKLFGEGKHVRTVKQPIPAGETLVLAGDDKNDTAWFVILTAPK